MTKFFSLAILVGMFAMGTSCSKDEAMDTNAGEMITLSVPAMPGFGDVQSRTVFEDNGTKPIVKWVKGDQIYLGSIKDVDDNTKLESLIVSGEFTTFKCVAVNESTGAATFQGTSIPEDADMAVYSKNTGNVVKITDKNANALSCDATNIAPKSNGDLTHLADNDLLVAAFDNETKTFKASNVDGYIGDVFARIFGLYKFELTLPDGVTGDLGNLTLSMVSTTGVAKPYNIDVKTGLPSASGIGSEYKVDCSNLSLDGNKLVCYAFAARKSNLKNETLKLNLKVGDNTYGVDILLSNNQNSIMYNSAIRFVETLSLVQ